MTAILGIDAAWTLNHRSGVALLRNVNSNEWECVAVDHSYEDFLLRYPSKPNVDWPSCTAIAKLIETGRRLAEDDVKLVVADIPLAKEPVRGRRLADDRISTLFGGFGCAAHSPSTGRPGDLSEKMRAGFEACGFTLATCQENLSEHSLIETYPHPALLSLMGTSYRVPYKVTKTKRYWPHLSLQQRYERVSRKLADIRERLAKTFTKIELAFSASTSSLSALKSEEDKVDALICAWVGIQVLEGKATALGDEMAAIWLRLAQFQQTKTMAGLVI
jgi:predicted RNase H-like nuclease